MTAAEAYMDELAELVAAKVEERMRKAPVMHPRLLTVEQASIVLGRSPDAVRKMVMTGKLKNASPDGRVQIDTKDIDILITNSKR
jgi:hypothetical protein